MLRSSSELLGSAPTSELQALLSPYKSAACWRESPLLRSFEVKNSELCLQMGPASAVCGELGLPSLQRERRLMVLLVVHQVPKTCLHAHKTPLSKRFSVFKKHLKSRSGLKRGQNDHKPPQTCRLMELMELTSVLKPPGFFLSGRRDARCDASDRCVTPSKSHEGPVLWFLEQNGESPESNRGMPGIRLDGSSGSGTERRANPAGLNEGHFRAPLPIQVRAPAGLGTERRATPAGRNEGHFRVPLPIQVRAPADRGTERRATPAGLNEGHFRAPSDTSEGPGNPCGTDQRPLPGAPPDIGGTPASRKCRRRK